MQHRFMSATLALIIGASPALANDTFFPPENISECRDGSILRWDGPGHSVRCENNATVPGGAVMAFALTECPAGWAKLENSDGRVIVGAGTLGSDNYNPGDSGGDAHHALSLAEMPKHSHPIRMTGGIDDYSLLSTWHGDVLGKGIVEYDWSGTNGDTRGLPTNSSDPRHSLFGANGDGLGPFTTAGYTGGTDAMAQGEAKEFDNRQPYMALLYCKKI